MERYAKIISASSEEAYNSIISSTLTILKRYETSAYLSYVNEGYQRAKQTFNITWGWPPNDSLYVKPDILTNGDVSYKISK